MSSLAVHPIDPADGGPYSVAVTADGAVWCSLVHGGAVLRRDSDGSTSLIELGPRGSSQPAQVAAAGDDSVWVADMAANAVVLVAPSGVLRRIDAPSPAAQPYGVTALHDGTAWFTEMGNDSLGRIGILGGVAEYATGTVDGVVSMVAASGDSLWFTANQANVVGYVRGADAAPALFPLPTPAAGPVGIVVGDDGAAWFTEILAGQIGRVDRAGRVVEHPLPDRGSKPHAIVRDARPDGGSWFTLWGSNELGHVTLDGSFSFVSLAESGHEEPHGLAVGLDGTVWVAMETGALVGVTV
ncbi:virginiamycin B lyase [Herbiconiux sp. CPCC 205716]|uniref:Virginiamycin B lyase n=1 Tax=Herbiconiux gentiana TaxID=2970912 RepID=A0ABT2GH64_9MICO|nr:virginiamycin B lyase [Herbiconiux gentiana]MCS5714136.1 virginiamycin B lyase [Herbiconiux gentiana]